MTRNDEFFEKLILRMYRKNICYKVLKTGNKRTVLKGFVDPMSTEEVWTIEEGKEGGILHVKVCSLEFNRIIKKDIQISVSYDKTISELLQIIEIS